MLNGFVYFYSVAGKDSTGQRDVNGGRGTLAEQEGRRAAIEADGVTPQSAQGTAASQVYVVPNPYRGSAQWDLTPNAADPTGTHVDFFNMPAGQWTLRIFTDRGRPRADAALGRPAWSTASRSRRTRPTGRRRGT